MQRVVHFYKARLQLVVVVHIYAAVYTVILIPVPSTGLFFRSVLEQNTEHLLSLLHSVQGARASRFRTLFSTLANHEANKIEQLDRFE